ncbi:MAG TPA: MMPL family transporter [Propionicimonas sp.]
MADLLYRLGRLAARRAWAFVAAWTLVIMIAGGSYALWGGGLTSEITIPGTETDRVTTQLARALPGAAGGTGSIVLSTDDGSAFTADQQTAVAHLLDAVAAIDGVEATVNPFTSQAQRAAQEQQLADAQTQIATAQDQLDAGQEQLDAASAQVAAGQAQLDAARAQAQAAGALAQAQAGLDAQQAQLDAATAQLATQQSQIDAGAQQLATQGATVKQGAALAQLARAVRNVSADGSAATATVVFDLPRMKVPTELKEHVVSLVEATPIDGVTAELSNDLTQAVPEVLGVGEVVGLAIAGIALLVMLGTAVAAALPILGALVGVGVGVTGVLALSGVVTMTSVTPILAVMLGLAVGIDYALFLINRHRHQLRDGIEVHESIGLATGTAGTAVVFAGSTVFVALLALNVTGIGFLGMMGTAGAAAVLVAVLVAITLTPAVLALLGTRILPRKVRAQVGHLEPRPLPQRPMSTGRAWVTLVAGVVGLAVLALPALSMRLGLPDGSWEPQDSTQYRANQVTAAKFGAGANGVLVVVAQLREPTTEATLLPAELALAQAIHGVGDVAGVAPVGVSDDGTTVIFQVVPVEGPDSETTEQLVRDLRAASPLKDGTTLGVAGTASGNIDVSTQLADSLPGYLGLVIGLSLIIMVMVFRSILVPLTATVGFIGSLFAVFGAITAIFQWGWAGSLFGVHDPAPILSFLPTILIGILFGLAMDYQLFLVSGMREAHVHGVPARLAVQRGLHAGRTVVTAAAVIMIAVFAGFVMSDSGIVRSLGFGLAAGVLLDAFVVRMLLIPAVMHLAGDAAWWIPRWLDRILPDADVEGAKLERTHPHPEAHHDSWAAADEEVPSQR